VVSTFKAKGLMNVTPANSRRSMMSPEQPPSFCLCLVAHTTQYLVSMKLARSPCPAPCTPQRAPDKQDPSQRDWWTAWIKELGWKGVRPRQRKSCQSCNQQAIIQDCVPYHRTRRGCGAKSRPIQNSERRIPSRVMILH